MQIRSARIISHFISNKYTSKFDARWDKREKKGRYIWVETQKYPDKEN
jgi:hypothetical protein